MALIDNLEINTDRYQTPNYDRHGDRTPVIIIPQGILLHEGSGTQESDLAELTGTSGSGRLVSSWAYVNRVGEIFTLGPDNRRYWHAGAPDHDSVRWWGSSPTKYGIYDGNLLLGIETEHRRGQIWPQVQLDALEALCRAKIEQYAFPIVQVGCHKWYAPSRKVDPTGITDAEFQEWINSWYTPDGAYYRVTEPRGARVRQGPATTFPISATLPDGFQFWSDKTIDGESIGGNNQWHHFYGAMPQLPNELGFVWSGICSKVTA